MTAEGGAVHHSHRLGHGVKGDLHHFCHKGHGEGRLRLHQTRTRLLKTNGANRAASKHSKYIVKERVKGEMIELKRQNGQEANSLETPFPPKLKPGKYRKKELTIFRAPFLKVHKSKNRLYSFPLPSSTRP